MGHDQAGSREDLQVLDNGLPRNWRILRKHGS
jgi:hypothetical protein